MITEIPTIRELKTGMPIRGIFFSMRNGAYPVVVVKRDSDGKIFCATRGDFSMLRMPEATLRQFAKFMGYVPHQYVRHVKNLRDKDIEAEFKDEIDSAVRLLERNRYRVSPPLAKEERSCATQTIENQS